MMKINPMDQVYVSDKGLRYWGKEKYGNIWTFVGGIISGSILLYNEKLDSSHRGHRQEDLFGEGIIHIGKGCGFWWFQTSFVERVVPTGPLDITELL